MRARRSPRSVRRVLAGSLASVGVVLVFAAVAVAGEYQLHANCTTVGGANHLFVASSTDTTSYTTSEECPTAGGRDGGIHVGETLHSPRPQIAGGAHAEYTFNALPGTTITGISYRRSLGQLGDNDVIPGLRDATGALVGSEWCQYPNGDFSCSRGSESIGVAPTDIIGLSTTALAFGLLCVPQAPAISCLSSVSNEQAWFSVYSADITIRQTTAPSLGTTSGSLLDGDWQQGTRTVALADASDTSGIEQLGLAIDGGVAAPPTSGATPTCDFTLPKPCRDLGTSSWSLDTTTLADGPHTAAVVVQNPAAVSTSTGPLAFNVDNTPPGAPVALSSSAGSGWQGSNRSHLTWVLPDQGQGSPISVAYTAVCNQSGQCGPITPSATPTDADISVPTPGTYVIRIWLEDAAGEGTYATVPFRYAAGAPAAPTAMSSSASAWQSSAVVDVRWVSPLRGADQPALHHGEVEVCATDGSDCAAPQAVGTAGGSITLPSEGTFLVRGWLVDDAGLGDRDHAATILARYSHTPPRLTLEPPPARTASPRFVATIHAEPGGPAPVVGVEWTACHDGTCPLTGTSTRATLSGVLPARGRWTLIATPVDAAGVRGAAIRNSFTIVRLDPRIRLVPTLRSGRLRVRASGDRRLAGRVTVGVRYRVRGSRHALRRTLRLRAGRGGAVFALPANVSRARVTGRFSGSATFRAARFSAAVVAR